MNSLYFSLIAETTPNHQDFFIQYILAFVVIQGKCNTTTIAQVILLLALLKSKKTKQKNLFEGSGGSRSLQQSTLDVRQETHVLVEERLYGGPSPL